MLHSVSCKNFYSFGNKTTISFVVSDKAPDNYGYFKAPSKTRLSKIEAVIGPNASGKTNLLKVVPFLKWLIIGSFNAHPSAPILVQPCLHKENAEKPIELSVEFEINKDIYIYEFSLKRARILSEELKVKNKTKKKITTKKIFSRRWNEAARHYSFEGKNFNLPKGFENLLRANASVIGVAMRLNHKDSQAIAKYWQQLETNVDEAGWLGDKMSPEAGGHLFEAFNFFSENEVLKKEAEKLLSRFDLGLEAIDIKKEKREKFFSFDINSIHSYGGEKMYLPFEYESSGTKQLFVLMKSILQVLDRGGVAVLDELDVNLHPEMVLALSDLFFQPETNPNNAQLLFSTHSLLLLSKLDKYQIIFTEKNEKGISEAWRLDEMPGVRVDDNYYAKYLAGAYGAVPKIM